jgi:O-antigen/teichoic acid export membrane protein
MEPTASRATWIRPTALLAVGGAISALLLFVGSLVIVHLYTPAELGAAAAFVSLVIMVSTVAALRYDLALPLVKTEPEATDLLVLCLALVVVTSTLVGAIAIALGPSLVRWIGAPEALSDLRFVVPVALAVMGAVVVLTQWATRDRAYPLLARTRVVQAASQVVAQASLGLAGVGAVGLALATMVGGGAGVLRLTRAPLAAVRRAPRLIDLAAMRRLAGRYRAFPKFAVFAAVCQSLALGCGPLLLAALYDLRVAGLFALALQVASVPMRILGEAVSRTYFGDAAALLRSERSEIGRRLRETAAVLAAIAALPVLVLAIWLPDLFVAVFGETWAESGDFGRALLPLFAAQFVVAPLNQTLAILERLELQAALAFVRLALMVGPLLVAHAAGASPLTAVTAFSLGGASAYALSLLVSDRVARGR